MPLATNILFVAVALKSSKPQVSRSTAFIETLFLNVSLYGHIKGIIENDQSNKNEIYVGNVLVGIDNHFQLVLYMTENRCQLESQTFL